MGSKNRNYVESYRGFSIYHKNGIKHRPYSVLINGKHWTGTNIKQCRKLIDRHIDGVMGSVV